MTDPEAAPVAVAPLPAGPFDVVVVGAGAAGLWCAGTAALRGRRVLLLEKNRRPGVKVLASGGGHCNVTTTLEGPALLDAFGREQGRFLAASMRRLPPSELRRRLDALGVATDVEPALEKVWPLSRRARDVADALVARAVRAGARLETATPVVDVARDGAALRVRTPRGDVVAPSVVLAVGGCSYPKTGTTGDGYAFAQALGHTVVRCVPALVPLVVETPWVRALAGIALGDARVTVVRDGKLLADRRRPTLFTHTGLSGPGPMDVSRWFEVLPPWHRPTLAIDLLPARGEEDVRRALLDAITRAPAERVARLLPGALPARLAEGLCTHVGVDPERRAAETSKADRHALVQALKRLTLPVAGTRGFDFAEVTAGGVALPEVEPTTMASRLVPGLSVVGELLDVDGPIGGFNFQAAFATGEAAGLAV
ncbi:MAG: NAD(P)/FAD-dependent oxidoreductase [Planctomycetes bacterium]|nr:NAD(P)/FAD-dependent oxidoreductase [Planctomycetota bacterium]